MKKERNGLKVLHKIGKSWVAVAAAGLIAAGLTITTAIKNMNKSQK